MVICCQGKSVPVYGESGRDFPFWGPRLAGSTLALGPPSARSRLYQDVGRNSQLVMKGPDHLEGESALLLKNFVDPGALPDQADQSASILALLLETELDGFDRIRNIDWQVLALIRSH